MKRNNNKQSLEEVINEYLKSFRLDSKLAEVNLIASWEKVMGKMIARYTKEIFIRNKVLYLKLTSSVLREELAYGKEKIIKTLNTEAGNEIINDIVFK